MPLPTLTELRAAAYVAPFTGLGSVAPLPGYTGALYSKAVRYTSNDYLVLELRFQSEDGVAAVCTIDDLDFINTDTVYDVEVSATDTGGTDYFQWTAGDTAVFGSSGGTALTNGTEVRDIELDDFGPLDYTTLDDAWHVDGVTVLPDDYLATTSLVFYNARAAAVITYGDWVTPDPITLDTTPDGISEGSGLLSHWYSIERNNGGVGAFGTFANMATDLTPGTWPSNEITGAPEVSSRGGSSVRIAQTWHGVLVYLDDRFNFTPAPLDDPDFIGWEWDAGGINDIYSARIGDVDVRVSWYMDRPYQIGVGGIERFGALADDIDVYLEPPGYGTLYDIGGTATAIPADGLDNVDYNPKFGLGPYFMVRDGLVGLDLLDSQPAADGMHFEVDLPTTAFADAEYGVGAWMASFRIVAHRQISLVAPTTSPTFSGGGDSTVMDVNGDDETTSQNFDYATTWQPARYRPIFLSQGRPPLAHRQRRDGVATVGPPLAHLQGGSGNLRPDLAHRQQTP